MAGVIYKPSSSDISRTKAININPFKEGDKAEDYRFEPGTEMLTKLDKLMAIQRDVFDKYKMSSIIDVKGVFEKHLNFKQKFVMHVVNLFRKEQKSLFDRNKRYSLLEFFLGNSFKMEGCNNIPVDYALYSVVVEKVQDLVSKYSEDNELGSVNTIISTFTDQLVHSSFSWVFNKLKMRIIDSSLYVSSAMIYLQTSFSNEQALLSFMFSIYRMEDMIVYEEDVFFKYTNLTGTITEIIDIIMDVSRFAFALSSYAKKGENEKDGEMLSDFKKMARNSKWKEVVCACLQSRKMI